ncbi:hypothetical protein ABW20_dc0104335 [Dactylellina cionopaga]|nr:hypothetical protein ABW20_dc0104335 [Dactylellina cionopaga]
MANIDQHQLTARLQHISISKDLLSSPLFSLPVELHIQILSYLPIDDQISAIQTCSQWQSILLRSKHLQKTRYHSPQESWQSPHTHKLLTIHDFSSGQFQEDNFDTLSGLMCLARGKLVEGYLYFRDREEGKGLGEHNGVCVFDMSKLSFLDEPFFSPFVRPASGAKLKAKVHVNSSDRGGHDRAKFTSASGSEPDDKSGKNMKSFGLRLYIKKGSYTYATKWSKHFDSDQPVTVRKLISTVVDEAYSELIKWDVYRDDRRRDKIALSDGCWINIFVFQDAIGPEDISICVTRSRSYCTLGSPIRI